MHFLELFAALGVVQGLLLLLLIGCRYRHRKNLSLALLVLVFSARLGTIPSWNAASLLAQPWLLPATTPLPFLFGPLVWWYVRELTHTEAMPLPRMALHGLPYLVDVVVETAVVVVISEASYRELVASLFGGAAPGWMTARNFLKVAVNVVYMGAVLRVAFARDAHRRRVGVGLTSNGSCRDHGRRLWLRGFAVAPLFSLVPFAYVALSPSASAGLAHGSALPFVILAAAMVGLIYLFSLLVLLAPNVPWHWPHGHPRAGSGVDAECAWIAGAVRRRLVEGAYRDPDVKRSVLADELGVTPNRLSFVVNQVYGESFPELMNRCRIDYFTRRVVNHALDEQTILDLALESGFRSKSTFNRVFKEHVGVTPSQFADAHAHATRRSRSERLPTLTGPAG